MFPISRIEGFFFFFFFFRSHIGSLLYFTRCRFYMKHIGWIFGPVSFHMTKLVSDPKNFTRTSSQPSPVFPKESCPFLDDSSLKASFRPTLALREKKKQKKKRPLVHLNRVPVPRTPAKKCRFICIARSNKAASRTFLLDYFAT